MTHASFCGDWDDDRNRRFGDEPSRAASAGDEAEAEAEAAGELLGSRGSWREERAWAWACTIDQQTKKRTEQQG